MAKQHDKQFKLDAVQYYQDHKDLGVRGCAENLGIGYSTLTKWLKDFRESGDIPVRGSGNYASDEQKEIARLRRELRDGEPCSVEQTMDDQRLMQCMVFSSITYFLFANPVLQLPTLHIMCIVSLQIVSKHCRQIRVICLIYTDIEILQCPASFCHTARIKMLK